LTDTRDSQSDNTVSDLWKSSPCCSGTIYFNVSDVDAICVSVKEKANLAWELQDMPLRPSLSERITSAFLGALFGGAIGLAVAWLLMFSSTLYLLGVGNHPISFVKSATAGAVFFATAGALFGCSTGTLVGHILAGIFEFERLDGRRNPWGIELVLFLVGIVVLLWVNGVFPV
jgi:hypothetical protein